MKHLKKILIGICCLSLLVMLPAVGYVADSADDQPATTQFDTTVKPSDEGTQDTQKATEQAPEQAPQQDQETQKQESETK
ncbi:MAG: hypothetical protein AB2L22_09865 [Syntrophales bacterium]